MTECEPDVDVTISVVSWNRVTLLIQCIDSVIRSRGRVTFEIIVVDNASKDDSVSVLRQRYPHVRTIVNAQNAGFGRAHNQAIKIARGRYICVLNSDATLQEDTLATLVAFMDRHPRAGIATCPVTQPDSSERRSSAVMYFPSIGSEIAAGLLEVFAVRSRRTRNAVERLSSRIYGRAPTDSDLQVAWAHGALLFLRATAVPEVGPFDERFFMYCEEIDLCLRVRRAGWEVWSTAGCAYGHLGKGSVSLRNDRELLYGESGTAYFVKHFGRMHGVFFRLQHFIVRRCLLSLRYFIGDWVRTGVLPRSHRWLSGRMDGPNEGLGSG